MIDPRAEELYREAKALAPAARRAYLDERCAGELELRAAVEARLESAPDSPPPGDAVGESERPGLVLGRFKLLQQIGEGGFGAVWMAEQREPVKRRVAIKILKLGMDTRQVLARFEAERQALAMMDHPNIAKVFDAGSTERGRPYFVMEYIRGVPILEYCDKERLDTRRRLELFVHVCHAIQHAHQKGVIHRDIKPTNVLVTLHDGVPVPKVIDFGVAKATNADLTERTLFTEHRQIIGTPAYMSPEQAEMSGLDIDTRTDIYSLGVLLYEVLTGTTPFTVEQLLTKGIAEFVRVVREVEPERPSTRLQTLCDSGFDVAALRRAETAGKLRQQLRGDLDWIVMKCLEKDRSRRYDTANALAQDVERHLKDEPVLAGPPTAAYRLRKFARRNRVQVIAGSVVLVALILGIVGTTWGWLWALDEKRRADDEAHRAGLAAKAEAEARIEVQEFAAKAVEAEKDAEARAKELEQVAQFQSAQLSGLDAERMGARLRTDLLAKVRAEAARTGLDPQAVEARAEQVEALLAGVDFTGMSVHSLEANVFRPALVAVSSGFSSQPLVRAHLDQALATTLRELGSYEMAEAPQIEALEIRRRELGEDDAVSVESLRSLALLHSELSRYDSAERAAREALERSRRALGPEHPETLECMRTLSGALGNQGRSSEARRLSTEALELARRVHGPEDPVTIGVMLALAAGFANDGEYEEAERRFTEVLAIQKRNGREDENSTRNAIGWLAIVEQNLGNLGAAERHSREYVDWNRRVYGDDHRVTLLAVNNLGWLLRRAGRFEDAERFLLQALEGRMRVLGEEHQHTLASMRNLAALYREMGRLPEAEAYARRAVEGMRRVLAPDHEDTLWALHELGKILEQQDRFEEASTVLREACDGYARIQLAGVPYALAVLEALTKSLTALGRAPEAHSRWREAFHQAPTPEIGAKVRRFVEDVRSDPGFEQRDDAWQFLDTLAAAQHAAGDSAAAVESQERALALLSNGRGECGDCVARLQSYRAAANRREGALSDEE